jgi:hypothetical protein
LEEDLEFLVVVVDAGGAGLFAAEVADDGEVVVVADAEVEFVVDDFGDPFPVCVWKFVSVVRDVSIFPTGGRLQRRVWLLYLGRRQIHKLRLSHPWRRKVY